MRLKATVVSIMGSDALRRLVRGLQLQTQGPIDLRNKSSMRAALLRADAATPALLIAELTAIELGEIALAFRIPTNIGRLRLIEELLQVDSQPQLPEERKAHQRPPRFVAIDFETADYQRDSACCVALVRVEGDQIVARECHLIRPPRRQFVFTHLHGIMWEDVKNQPTFAELWPRLTHMLLGIDFLAAHNAPFDRSVLRTCCELAGLAAPELPFLCTVRLARQTWQLHPTKLSDVCMHLKIALQHHHAASDAEACARIVMAAHQHRRAERSVGYVHHPAMLSAQ
jgi:DNA polymerase-3 subunit epsilon